MLHILCHIYIIFYIYIQICKVFTKKKWKQNVVENSMSAIYMAYLYTTQHHSDNLATGALGTSMSTVCHSCGFACQHRVLKIFLGPGYLHSENGISRDLKSIF